MTDWRDICETCGAVIEMPEDLGISEHACPSREIPWRRLAQLQMITRLAVDSIEYSIAKSVEERVGPFLPWDPPAPRLLGDLLLWSREYFAELDHVGKKSVQSIEDWLRRQGYEFRPLSEITPWQRQWSLSQLRIPPRNELFGTTVTIKAKSKLLIQFAPFNIICRLLRFAFSVTNDLIVSQLFVGDQSIIAASIPAIVLEMAFQDLQIIVRPSQSIHLELENTSRAPITVDVAMVVMPLTAV